MHQVSQSDFNNWLLDPVTKAFRQAIAEYVSEVKEVLATSAGLEPSEDNFKRGYITALLDALNTSVVTDGDSYNGN